MNNQVGRRFLEQLAHIRVCVLGDVMLDRYSYGVVQRISPEAPVPIIHLDRQEYVPGGAANVFANLCALGVQTTLVGVIGNDSDGRTLHDECERRIENSISTVSLLAIDNRPTTVKHRMVAQTQQVLRVDTEETSPLAANDIHRVWSVLEPLLQEVDVVVVADYAKGLLTPELAERLMQAAVRLRLPVVVDTKPSHFDYFKGATLLTPNEKETLQLFPDTPFDEAGRLLASRCDAHVLATRSEKGMAFFPKPGQPAIAEFALTAVATDVRDVSGAGDTVTAVAAVGIAAGLTFVEAAQLSNCAAAVVVGKAHTATVTAAELEACLRGVTGVSVHLSPQAPEKLLDIAAAAQLVRQYQQQGLVVGCLSGSFDLISALHFQALTERTDHCDVLIVLLNSDLSVRRYKGKNKPILHQSERAYVLAQSAAVRHIVLFDELTPVGALSILKPDIYFNVSEWGADCVERPVVEAYGGKVVVFDFPVPPDWCRSSSALVQRVLSAQASPSQRAVFLDRDGVLNENGSGYLYRWEDMVILPGVVQSLLQLQQAGYILIVITNQSGVGRGYYSEADVVAVHQKMADYFASFGVLVTHFYYCPHHPEAGCLCRKPGVGMFLQAADEYDINLSKSWCIGDSATDIEAARMANVHSILLAPAGGGADSCLHKPNHTAPTIAAATAIILAS